MADFSKGILHLNALQIPKQQRCGGGTVCSAMTKSSSPVPSSTVTMWPWAHHCDPMQFLLLFWKLKAIFAFHVFWNIMANDENSGGTLKKVHGKCTLSAN